MHTKSSFFILPLSLFFLLSCEMKKTPPARPPVPVTAFKVERGEIPADFTFVGVAKSSHPVEIRCRVEGYIWAINYTEGSMVNQNDLLFTIDPRQFEASLQEAKGELERQEAILWRAKRSLERIEPLYKKNAASLRDLDDAIASVLSAEASVLTAKGNYRSAELNLSYTQITSPIKGLTARAAFREGTLITPSVNGLLTVVSVIDPIWVLFSVSDNQLLQGQGEQSHNQIILPKTQEYTVNLEFADGSKFPYVGSVNFTSPTLDEATGAMVVRATFPNPEGTLLPEQFVRATVSGAIRPNAIAVPQEAVCQGQKGMYVLVIDKTNKVSMRPVQVGEWYKEYWIITQGLEAGDVIVVNGVNKVQEGSQIEILSYHPGVK